VLGRKLLSRPKHLKNEAVVPYEEEEEAGGGGGGGGGGGWMKSLSFCFPVLC
jgi:hypothetical protein